MGDPDPSSGSKMPFFEPNEPDPSLFYQPSTSSLVDKPLFVLPETCPFTGKETFFYDPSLSPLASSLGDFDPLSSPLPIPLPTEPVRLSFLPSDYQPSVPNHPSSEQKHVLPSPRSFGEDPMMQLGGMLDEIATYAQTQSEHVQNSLNYFVLQVLAWMKLDIHCRSMALQNQSVNSLNVIKQIMPEEYKDVLNPLFDAYINRPVYTIA